MLSVENLIRQFLFNPKWKPFRHISFWIFMYLDETLSFVGITDPLDDPWLLLPEIILDIVIVYFNLYFLIPIFFQRRKLGLYALLTFLSVLVNALLYFIIESRFYTYDNGVLSVYLSTIVSTLSTLGTAIGLKLLITQVLQAEMREQITKEKTSIELQYLKNQINPHFLFNVLNTIYVQTQIAPQEAQKSVMQLSDLLRYQIYGASQKDIVSLKDEIDFLKNYIDLELLRREFLEVTWQIDIPSENIQLPPFLLLPLVENAIKHSKSTTGKKEIIEIACTYSEGKLSLKCVNSKGDNQSETGGLGLTNLCKRLELLYSDHYSLDLQDKGATFIAELAIDNHEILDHR